MLIIFNLSNCVTKALKENTLMSLRTTSSARDAHLLRARDCVMLMTLTRFVEKKK